MLEGKKKYNPMMIRITIILLLLTFSAVASVSVAVSIAPQKYFVEQIMGEGSEITVLVPNGSSPATYAPKPSQLKALNKASLYFSIGVAFEKNWLPRFASINKKLKVIDTCKGITKRTMAHKHGDHHHEGLDPHIWLSPKLVMIQAKTIKDALVTQAPSQKEKYEKNYKAFVTKLEALDEKIKAILSPLKQKSFIVFHPSFGYLSDDYGLTQIAIEKEGKEPSLRHIKRVIDYAKEHKIKTVFVAPQFSQKAASQIAKQIGADVNTINPLSVDWETNLLDIAKSFEKAN